MSYFWLILKMLPFLFGVAAIFYRLGVKAVHAQIATIIQEKDARITEEQARRDATIGQLAATELEFNTLTSQYEQLQNSAVPRRKLSEAEATILKLECELASLRAGG